GRAASDLTRDGDSSAQFPREHLADCQAKPGTCRVAGAEPAELLEDVVLLVRGNASATIGDLQDGPAASITGRASLMTYAHRDRAVRSVLDRIGEQVGGDLPHARPVGLDDHALALSLHREGQSTPLRCGVVL